MFESVLYVVFYRKDPYVLFDLKNSLNGLDILVEFPWKKVSIVSLKGNMPKAAKIVESFRPVSIVMLAYLNSLTKLCIAPAANDEKPIHNCDFRFMKKYKIAGMEHLTVVK
jgi:hypothetical protein